jgi:hypothetical protein
MNIFTCSRIILFLFFLVVLAATTQTPRATSVASSVESFQHKSNVSNSTFYLLRPDLRRCASPMCGGYFVHQVNSGLTRCANGRQMSECYVANIDWSGMAEAEITKAIARDMNTSDPNASTFTLTEYVVDFTKLNGALLRGYIVSKGNRNGRYGVLKASEVWNAANDEKPYGDFYRVRDLGIRCIAAPCLTHQEAKLNAPSQRKIAGVDLNDPRASQTALEQAQTRMTSSEGIIVAGGHSTVTGPAGQGLMLKASQFYLRQPPTKAEVGLKPCIKTGCSSQICSDHAVMTTCEWRPEYECYQKATCERQSNGDCGFTKTKELTDCLARVR